MYNRYIRNDHGTYTRVQEEEHPVSDVREAGLDKDETPPEDFRNQGAEGERDGARRSPNPESARNEAEQGERNQTEKGSRSQAAGGTSGDAAHSSGNGSGDSLRRMLAQLRLGNVDTGDLILLMLLFLLFQENADEEVLAALGLLLIL